MGGHELLDALRSHLDERHQYLCQRLDDLDDGMRLLYGALVSRLDEHDAYHRRNEHRWGLVRLAQRHPWRLAAMAFLCGGVVIAANPASIHFFTWCLKRLIEEMM